MDLPVMPPVAPMLAKPVPELPDGPWSFEPKWDGFRTIVFRDGDEVELGSRNERPMTRYFPEVVEAVPAARPAPPPRPRGSSGSWAARCGCPAPPRRRRGTRSCGTRPTWARSSRARRAARGPAWPASAPPAASPEGPCIQYRHMAFVLWRGWLTSTEPPTWAIAPEECIQDLIGLHCSTDPGTDVARPSVAPGR